MNTVDQAVAAVTAAEATYNADLANVTNIQTAIDTANGPLAAAQATVVTDKAAFVAALNGLVAAAQAQLATLNATN